MDLLKKAGQLFIIGFQGSTISREHSIARDITEYNLGGVILFDKSIAKKRETNNIVNLQQLKTLTTKLQQCGKHNLFISVDQEGGFVNRLKESHGFWQGCSAQEIGERDDHSFTKAQAGQCATTLSAAGINLNFAPVVDLNTEESNPIITKYGRSFSHDSKIVTSHSKTWIETFKKHGICCCLKHFPGHGSAKDDSHLGFVDISKSWQDKELSPYTALIHDQIAEMIMVGHLYNENLDPDWIATLSPLQLNELLRKKMKYDGVIVTDDMQMGAISNNYGFEESIQQALIAGIDLFIFGNNLNYDEDILQKSLQAIEKGLKCGRLKAEHIEIPFTRIQRLKESVFQTPSV